MMMMIVCFVYQEKKKRSASFSSREMVLIWVLIGIWVADEEEKWMWEEGLLGFWKEEEKKMGWKWKKKWMEVMRGIWKCVV